MSSFIKYNKETLTVSNGQCSYTKVRDYLVAKTQGWHKAEVIVSAKALAQKVGISLSSAKRAIKKLLDSGIFVRGFHQSSLVYIQVLDKHQQELKKRLSIGSHGKSANFKKSLSMGSYLTPFSESAKDTYHKQEDITNNITSNTLQTCNNSLNGSSSFTHSKKQRTSVALASRSDKTKILNLIMAHTDELFENTQIWSDDHKRLQQTAINAVLEKYDEALVIQAIESVVSGNCYSQTRSWFRSPKRCKAGYKNSRTLIKLIETHKAYVGYYSKAKMKDDNIKYYLSLCKQKQYLDRGVSFELKDNCVFHVVAAERYCEKISIFSPTFQAQISNIHQKYKMKRRQDSTILSSGNNSLQQDLLNRFIKAGGCFV